LNSVERLPAWPDNPAPIRLGGEKQISAAVNDEATNSDKKPQKSVKPCLSIFTNFILQS
jgi:hypothetical protein